MKRTITVLAVLVAMVAGALALAPGVASAAETSRCDEGHWPASVQVQPASYKVGGTAGYSIWHDRNGWHLRTTTPSTETTVFSGRIVSEGNIKAIRVYRNETADSVKVSGNVMTFSFKTHNHVDGIDFLVGCTARLRFALSTNGRPTPVRRIWLGKHGHAPGNPFIIHRVD
jgi:hypothetical protein